MVRVGLAPCSPFSVTGDLMRETAELARASDNVNLHTHVAETADEETFCIEQFGARPAEYMRQLGWVGPDVWWAHAIYLNDDEIQMMADTGTGVAHCPTSNMLLGSGIAKVRQLRDAGVKVGIGVDGSASNDGNDLLLETRLAMLLQRVEGGADAFGVVEALELAMVALTEKDVNAARRVGKMKRSINSLERAAAAHQAGRLVAHEPNRVSTYRLEIDLIANLKRVYYFSKRMARVVVPPDEKASMSGE